MTPVVHVDFTCPDCGWNGSFDRRFVVWCMGCGRNADPRPPEPESRRTRRARARAEGLFERLRTAGELRPTTAARASLLALALVVHLLTVALLVGSVLLVVAFPDIWMAWVGGALGVATAVAVGPRPAGKPRGTWLRRDDAPRLFALLDRCAAELGARPPVAVGIDGRFNASTSRRGLRRDVRIALGAPLWSVLTGPERLALLGHELAHQVNGDITHSLWTWSARRSLAEWMRVFDPRQSAAERASLRRLAGASAGRSSGNAVGAALAPWAMAVAFLPLFLVAFCCDTVLLRLDLACGQRSEYLADELCARLASTDGAVGLMEKLMLRDAVALYLRPAGRRDADPWQGLRDYLASVPEHEKRRQVRVQQKRGARVDATHPADHLRRALLLERGPLPVALKVGAEEWAAVDAELAPHFPAARPLT